MMREDYQALLQARVGRLFARCEELQAEAVLVLDIHNIRYFTGFTGSEGTLVAAGGRIFLLVDGRYITQARAEARFDEVIQFSDRQAALAQLIGDWGLRTMAVEAAGISLQQFTDLSRAVPHVEIKTLKSEISELRAVKDKYEISKIKQAAGLAGKALKGIMPLLKPGKVEKDIALEFEYMMRKGGSRGVSFDSIVASGRNSALPHARPSGRRLRRGDFVVLDYGCVSGGYHSDETCTFGIGAVSAKQARVYEIVKDAHDRALSVVRAGVPCREVDSAARSFIEKKGFGPNFSHGTGHGVGLEVHEHPRISFQSDAVLEKGMVVTIEPGIYLPGRFGVRIESLVAVTEKGCEILSPTDKKLNIIT